MTIQHCITLHVEHEKDGVTAGKISVCVGEVMSQ